MQQNNQLCIINEDKKGRIYVTWLTAKRQQVIIDPYEIAYNQLEVRVSPAEDQTYVIQIANNQQPPRLFFFNYNSNASQSWRFKGEVIQ